MHSKSCESDILPTKLLLEKLLDCSNRQYLSNLPYLSKVVEKYMLSHLFQANYLLPEYESAYRNITVVRQCKVVLGLVISHLYSTST